jgi:hypothetical protein
LKILIFWDFSKFWNFFFKIAQNDKYSFLPRIVSFWDILAWESGSESFNLILSQNEKKNVFQVLVKLILKKISTHKSKISQKCKILIFRFLPKNYLEAVLPASKYEKWIFWIILSISCPGNFFHRTFSFFSKRVWKLLFFDIFQNFEIFSSKLLKMTNIHFSPRIVSF